MENGIKNPIRLITEKQLAGLFTETMRYCDVIPQGRSCDLIGVVKKTLRYSNVFFYTPVMPHFRITEHYCEKRYKR